MKIIELVLSANDYSRLVGALAERRLEAFQAGGVGSVYITDNSGGTHYTDWAQDQFDNELNEIENILKEIGIHREWIE